MSFLNTSQLLLKGGRLICPRSNLNRIGDLLIDRGKIVSFKNELSDIIDSVNFETIDCTGLFIAPGLIDLHVHLREPGEEYKETILSSLTAAAAGGFTSICCMPNTNPINDSRAVTEMILECSRRIGFCRVYPIGAITQGLKGKHLSHMAELQMAGCVAVSDDGRPVENSQVLRRAMEYASGFNLPVICHSEELNLSAGGVMHEGPTAVRLGLRGIPAQAETIAVERDLGLAQLTGANVHIAHISCAGSVAAIRRAKAAGVRISCETAPHYLVLIDENVGNYNTDFKINPPLRSFMDREAVRYGLADGTIDIVATDHAPHSILEKMMEFDKAAFGVIGLETCLGVMLKLVNEGFFSLFQVIDCLTNIPAQLLGLPGGVLKEGGVADIVVIDPQRSWLVDPAAFKSLSHNTPFVGWELPGRAVLTICDGQITHRLEGF